MLMTKVRAHSYVRRSLSQPVSRRRHSAARPVGEGDEAREETSIGVPSRRLQLQLLASDSLFGSIDEETGVRSFSLGENIKGVCFLLSKRLNLLLLFIPLGLAAQLCDWGALPVFLFNFLALIPLANLLGTVTEDLALHTGEVIGGLLNATFGNAVEMILSIQGLRRGMVSVVQATLFGSILSNLLLVLGMAFFLGGLKHHTQTFNAKGATCNTSLLLLSSIGIAVPTVAAVHTEHRDTILTVSRVTAVVMATTYSLFLYFQLHTHISLFQDDNSDETEWPQLSWGSAVLMIGIITIFVSIHSEYLISSINGVIATYAISRDFIGIILLPIVGNAAEHITAITVAVKDKLDLTMGVAVGSSTQIALFVVPSTILMGWVLNCPMTLAFSPLSTVILILAILVVLGVVQDGETNWLEGVMLMATYIIVGVTFWYIPPDE